MTVNTVDIPTDEGKDLAPESTHEHSCIVCGKELHYAGRGRKPRYCEEHKKGGNRTGAPRKTGNETLAAQATETLMMGNTLIAIGLRAGKMPLTAEALEIAKDGFREQVYLSLMADPALCRTILKGGSAGARVSLILAYASLASIIVPTAMMELQVRRA